MQPFDQPLLQDAEELPTELRVGLERLRAKRPSPERLAAMAAAVGAGATASSAASPASGATELPIRPATQLPAKTAALVSPAGKLLLVLGVVVTGIVVFLLLRPRSPDAVLFPSRQRAATPSAENAQAAPPEHAEMGVPSGAPVSEQARAPAPALPGSGSASSALEPPPMGNPDAVPSPSRAETPSKADAPAATGAPSTAPRATSELSRDAHLADTARAPTPRPPRPTTANATEAELLRDARQTLESSPLIALSLCQEHQRTYPNGGLTQERELIAIAALLRLGRTSSAQERAARFRASYPQSPHLARLDRLLPP